MIITGGEVRALTRSIRPRCSCESSFATGLHRKSWRFVAGSPQESVAPSVLTGLKGKSWTIWRAPVTTAVFDHHDVEWDFPKQIVPNPMNQCLNYYRATIPYCISMRTKSIYAVRRLEQIKGEVDQSSIASLKETVLSFTEYSQSMSLFTQETLGISWLSRYL